MAIQKISPMSSTFNVGEVPFGERLHRDTARTVAELEDGEYMVKVKAKKRPMLIFGPASRRAEYPVLEFTSQRPDDNAEDFLLQDNGKPRSFGRMLGFQESSYLRIYPANQCPASKLEESGISPFPQIAMMAFVKLHNDRLLRSFSYGA